MLSRKLEYLLALAKEGHFARAAAVCNVTQPTLSAGIQQLEMDLGVRIVRRGQRFQGFTKPGEIVLAWAQRGAIECQKLHQELRDLSGQVEGTIQLGVVGSAMPIVSFLTVAFAERCPNINLRVGVQSAALIRQGIEEFSLDLGLTVVDKTVTRGGRAVRFYDEKFHLLIHRSSQLSGKSTVSWKQVKQLRLCLFTPETHFLGPRETELLWAPQPPQIATNSILLLIAHVRTGQWASVVPRTIVPMIAEYPELEAIPLPPTNERSSIGLVIPRREPISPVAEAFFEVASSAAVSDKIKAALHPKRHSNAFTVGSDRQASCIVNDGTGPNLDEVKRT